MTDTREKILLTALELFAQNGYEAVSVSDIAGRLRITKGALYRHYENKRDILDSIVARMFELDEARARENKMPEATFDRSPEAYRRTAIESIKHFTLAQFEFWTRDSFAAPFRRSFCCRGRRSSLSTCTTRRCRAIWSGRQATMLPTPACFQSSASTRPALSPAPAKP